jgi:colanic acid biosynthesis glycosyl transferase WcaI
MRILVHDYSGHPFQVELSSELADRGHHVTHSYCAAYVSGKGKLSSRPPFLTVEPIGVGQAISKEQFVKRLFEEVAFGVSLVRQIRRVRPDVSMFSNVPVPTLVVVAMYLMVVRSPWVLWHQDVQAVAIRSFAGEKLPASFRLIAAVIGRFERWCARRAKAVVVIAPSFVDIHAQWGTAEKTSVIPNWAPLDEIVPLARDNEWSREHGLSGSTTLLYSGTLGLKHNPALLAELARRVIDLGVDAKLVVVNEGPAEAVVRERAADLHVPLELLPFQPYERLSEVLASGDVLVVLLDQSAGAFSVPSKTLSYLCAGRPILGLMPGDNLASTLVTLGGGCVLPPTSESLDEAAKWVASVVSDPTLTAEISDRSRSLAELDFNLASCADKFEKILTGSVR